MSSNLEIVRAYYDAINRKQVDVDADHIMLVYDILFPEPIGVLRAAG